LKTITIVEYLPDGPATTEITGAATACDPAVAGGGVCQLVDESPVADSGVAEEDLKKADGICQTATSDWCRCQGDPSASEQGEWNCAPFAPSTKVIATFDRLIDTTPFEPDSGVEPEAIAALTASPVPPSPPGPGVDYSSTGSPTTLVFGIYSPNWGYFVTGNPNDNNYRWAGPSIQVVGEPTLPSGATVSIDLSKTNVRAKDGKTPFTGTGLLQDGALKFNTAPFSVAISAPHGEELPPPAPMDGGVDAGASDAGVADASTDTATPPPAPTTGPVPADMNMGAITLTFNNLVEMSAEGHVKISVDGAPFTAFSITSGITKDDGDGGIVPAYPTNILVITPNTMWEAGKSYTVTVDANVADATGVKLGHAEAHTFVMAN
jgi:hypothetical protein